MAKWQVYKLVKKNGNIPYDKWFKQLTKSDRAKVEQAILAIEGFSEIPAEKVKKYRDLHELKIYGGRDFEAAILLPLQASFNNPTGAIDV